MQRMPLPLIVVLACLPMLAHAAPDCGMENNTATYAHGLGPNHHPIARPLPYSAEFNQPVACGDGAWYFDLNHNGRPDPGEPKLYGPQRVIACSSCHADSPDAKTETASSVFLRQDPAVLCLICHKL